MRTAPTAATLPPDARTAAALLAVDPVGLGGVLLGGASSAARERWLGELRALLPEGTPWRRVPAHIQDPELLGGLDLAATLRAGRPVAREGLLPQAHGGLVLLPAVQRQPAALLARLHRVLDTGELPLERDGLSGLRALALGVVAIDDRLDQDDEGPAPGLADRLGLQLNLDGEALDGEPPWDRAQIAAARTRLARVSVPEPLLQAVCASALALGIASLRAPSLALRAARAAAALLGETQVSEAHAGLALALVLMPRATQWPAPPEAEAPPQHAEAPPQQAEAPSAQQAGPPADHPAAEAPPPDPDLPNDPDRAHAPPSEDRLLDATRASLPPGLLAWLAQRAATPRREAARSAGGRQGTAQRIAPRGRSLGARRGRPGGLLRLSLIDTLRAAAPWQGLRQREHQRAHGAAPGPRVLLRPDDLHVMRRRQVRQATTLFVVDASGSSALHRLAEAKGAVELLLAECYVRRDRVALLAFRGSGSELLLPPTRSLTRAKRCLAGLPGGGGTPLASALDQAGGLVDGLLRRGEAPQIVLLTDGRANIASDGTPGRERATADALDAARRLRHSGAAALLIDTSPRPQPQARGLADALGAQYLPLPHAGAGELSRAIRQARSPASASASAPA